MKKTVIGILFIILSSPSFANNRMMATMLANKVYQMLRSPSQSATFSMELSNLLRLSPSIPLKDFHTDDFYTLFSLQEGIADSVRTLLAEKYGWSVDIDENTFNENPLSLPPDHISAIKDILNPDYGLTNIGRETLALMKDRGYLTILFNPDGTTNPLYANMDGQVKFADEHYEGDMEELYSAVHASQKEISTNNTVIMPTGWYFFQGSTEEYSRIQQTILDYFMARIDLNQMVLLLKEDLLENIILVLRYGHPLFNKHITYEIANSYIKEHLLDETGAVREKYTNPQGLQLLAHRYFAGDEYKAYQLAQEHLDSELFEQLKWEENLLSTLMMEAFGP